MIYYSAKKIASVGPNVLHHIATLGISKFSVANLNYVVKIMYLDVVTLKEVEFKRILFHKIS